VTQAANLILARDLQFIVEVGRACAAFAGGVLVFATVRLARLVLPELATLAAAAATAATPLVTVHARIFKEDIVVAPFVIQALAALIKLLELRRPAVRSCSASFSALPPGQNISGSCSCPSRLPRSSLFPARAHRGGSGGRRPWLAWRSPSLSSSSFRRCTISPSCNEASVTNTVTPPKAMTCPSRRLERRPDLGVFQPGAQDRGDGRVG
jgi:hypothetical protein